MGLLDSIKKHFRFGKEETIHLIISILVVGFILSFRYWGGADVDYQSGFYNLVGLTLVGAFSLLIHMSVPKVMAIKQGATVSYRLWPLGVLLSLVACFVSNGWFVLLLLGGINFSSLYYHLLGREFQELTMKARIKVAFSGIFSNLLLAAFFKYLIIAGKTNLFIEKAFVLNLLLAFYSVLPLFQWERVFAYKSSHVNLDGFHIFYASKPLWLFSIIFVLLFILLIIKFNALFSLVFSALIGMAIALIYLYYKML